MIIISCFCQIHAFCNVLISFLGGNIIKVLNIISIKFQMALIHELPTFTLQE